MIAWGESWDLPRDLASGCSFPFRRLSKRIFHVTLVVHNGEALCWSIEGAGAICKLPMDQDVALVTLSLTSRSIRIPPDHYRDRQRQEMHAAGLTSENAATKSILSLRGATACGDRSFDG